MNQVRQKQLTKYSICVLLVVITAAAYASVAGASFIAFDDQDYIVGNSGIQQGFSWNAVKWAFTTIHSNNWHPLTWFSHMLDFRFYGLDPAEPHLVNLAFHIANTVLLFLLLYNLTAKLWPSAFVAVIFAIHPMHVESVAWVSERKDVLSTFFLMLTLLAYARYVELAVAKKRACWAVYGLALLLFALGLMAKPMLVTVPGILCLLDFWPLRRFQFPLKGQRSVLRRLVIEKIPFVLFAALLSWVTFHVQNTTGAVQLQVLNSITDRLVHVPAAYAWYVMKLFWPTNLSVYYLLRTSVATENPFLSCLVFIGITVFALMRIRKSPYILVGWLWFVGTLVPVIGLVQVGNQAYADRYAYVPYIGLLIIVAWGIPELLAKWPQRSRQVILSVGATLLIATSFWRTVAEVHYWKNGFLLLNRAIEVDPKDEYPWLLLGLEYEIYGNNDKAIECATQATVLNDNFNLAWHNLGHMLEIKCAYAGAIDAFQRAESTSYYVGDKRDIYDDLGDLLMQTGQYDQAIANYQSSLALYPNQPLVQKRLAQCLANNNEPDQAIAAYQGYLNSQPNDREAHLDFAMLLGKSGRNAEAIPHYRKVIELNTNVLLALNNLAWLLATDPDPKLRDGKEAVPLAEHACEITHYQEAFLIGTLAAAYAEAGRFNDAVAAAQKAHDVALAHGQTQIAQENLKLMQLYKSGKPFHMDAVPPPSQKP